jgi:hypothetical protein
MKQWNEKYGQIIDIDSELKEVEENIKKFKLRKLTKKLQEEEEMQALLL